MSIYFVDSSALAKRYLTEDGNDWLRAISARSAGHQLFMRRFHWLRSFLLYLAENANALLLLEQRRRYD